MQPSMFNVQVPLPERNEVFLMNTFSDAQLLVSPDVAALLERVGESTTVFTEDETDALDSLEQNGFLVTSRDSERRSLDEYFRSVREDREELRVTVLTTLQCNFACDYCIQGDHGDHNLFARKMSLDTAEHVAAWIERKLDEIRPAKFVLTFFGGEPLLNLPVTYFLSERCHELAGARGVKLVVNIITNGLLLTPEVVDRLLPYGLNGVKVTLDGDRETHNRMRPLRGRQGTFDRIVENVRRVADKVKITIGGNFDETSVDSFPALLDFLKEQNFADKLAKVNFKPIIKTTPGTAAPPKGFIPLTAVGANGKPLGGACMTTAGAGTSVKSACDTCHFVDEKMTFLREETRKRGFPTVDGVHMGPCEIHRKHAYTVGTEGDLFACPGFAGEASESVGRVNGGQDAWQAAAARRFDALAPYKNCGDCSFIPVCAGGCAVASHTELGDMNTPSCHKESFEAALVGLAHIVASGVENSLV
ncbi:MAG TPA: radical SAM protein [Vicinamibacterales bacterium]|nr:radical SAM protein [Vicinamibacterales bacterium]